MHSDPQRLEPGRVAIIGPGRVGTTLAAALTQAGHRVVAVSGGSEAARGRFVSRFAGAISTEAASDAAGRAELVLVTTPDDAIESVVTAIAVGDGFQETQHVVHTSGALGLAPLRRAALAGARVAACHPAQTFPEGMVDPAAIVGVAWAVTAASDDRGWAHDLVEQLGGTPHELPETGRVLYHAGLAVASNAVGAAVAVSRQLLRAAGVDDPAPFLGPLVSASADNAVERGADALTGPVVRGDVGTVHRHLAELEATAPHLAAAYRHLSAVIVAQVRPVLDPDVAARLDQLLETAWNE